MEEKMIDLTITNNLLNDQEENIVIKIKNKKLKSNYLLIINNKKGENKEPLVFLYADDEEMEEWEG